MQLPFKISPFQKALSFILPVSVSIQESALHPYLEFLLYKNQLQLATEDAVYSDGDRYLPYRLAFKKIGRERLETLSSCLVLGGGLGSIIQILHKQYHLLNMHYTLVELDPEILKYARMVLQAKKITDIQAHCTDSCRFMQNEKALYDLVCIDVFRGREVPAAFLKKSFFENIKKKLMPDGIWVMNYIKNEDEEWNTLWNNVNLVFPHVTHIRRRENIILIGKAPEQTGASAADRRSGI